VFIGGKVEVGGAECHRRSKEASMDTKVVLPSAEVQDLA
jgi:hypothetical protein